MKKTKPGPFAPKQKADRLKPSDKVPTTKTSVRLPNDLWERFRMVSIKRHTTTKALMEQIVRDFVESEGKL